MPPVSRRRRGVTLFELIVVLVILGIGGALVVPAMRDLQGDTASERDPWSSARRLAARRGEPVRLVVAADGRWQASADADTTDRPLDSGRLAAGPTGTWLVTAVGACLPMPAPAAPPPSTEGWDPVRCTPIRLAAAPR